MKITDLIEGYAEMTAEEKEAAIAELDIPADNTDEYKKLISKANAEAKKYKDEKRALEEQLKAKMSDDERAKAEAEAEMTKLKEQYESAIKESNIAKKTAHYKALGFSDELAKSTAEAFVNGDYDTVEANQIKAHSEFEKSIRADVAKGNPHPETTGNGTKKMTKAEIMAVKDSAKRQSLIKENIELFQ